MCEKIFLDGHKNIVLKKLPKGAFSKEVASKFRLEQKQQGYTEFLITNDFLTYLQDFLHGLNCYIFNIQVEALDDNIPNLIKSHLKQNPSEDDRYSLSKLLQDTEQIEKIRSLEFYYKGKQGEVNSNGVIFGEDSEVEELLQQAIKEYLSK